MNRHSLAAQAHTIPARALQDLVIDRVDWFDRGNDIRRELATEILHARTEITCWQDAWNSLTGATEDRLGQLRLSPAKCSECRGRRFSTRSIQRGSNVCLTCHGSGRGRSETLRTRYAAAPAAEEGQ